MYSLSFDSSELKDMVTKRMRHPYVEKYIQKPFIDDEKLSILHELYNQVDLPIYEKQQSIITVLLVQIALDTHELIPTKETERMCESEIQLSVLAGDYYSGLYYLLLAEIEEMEMIQVLATSIKQINECKMKLFYRDATTFEELLDEIRQTEALLFMKTAEYLGYEKSISYLIGEVLLLNRLQIEIQSIEENKHSYIYQFVQNQNMSNRAIIMIEQEINRLKDNINRLSDQLPYSFQLKDYFKKRNSVLFNTSIAKEG